MAHIALSCPQCGGPLPKRAWWSMVTCPFCSAAVTKSRDVVQAAWFREARDRVYAALEPAPVKLRWREQEYRVLAHLGTGEHCDVLFAERVSPLPERVTLKLLRVDAVSTLAREEEALSGLQHSQVPGAAYFSQRLPQPVGVGVAIDEGGRERQALVLRHPTGYWGTLADAMHNYPHGIDARHAVWIWRRILEVLAFVHDSGWVHGDLAPEHLLVQPRDHGVLMIGWGRARRTLDNLPPGTPAGARVPARDLMQSAWSMRALLAGGAGEPMIPAATPAPLAALLDRASTDAGWCTSHGARGIEQELVRVAHEAFGAPRFVAFDPDPHALRPT